MTDCVPCPECGGPAHVLDDFTDERATGAVRYLRLECGGPPSFLVTAEEIERDGVDLSAEPRVDGVA